MRLQIQPGDLVVYQKTKHSLHPSRHAKAVYPALNGDSYSYRIDKYWTVVAVQPTGEIVVCTRRGKTHTLHADDPSLRRATWWERLWLRNRFPPMALALQSAR
jgi:hypothetical protein